MLPGLCGNCLWSGGGWLSQQSVQWWWWKVGAACWSLHLPPPSPTYSFAKGRKGGEEPLESQRVTARRCLSHHFYPLSPSVPSLGGDPASHSWNYIRGTADAFEDTGLGLCKCTKHMSQLFAPDQSGSDLSWVFQLRQLFKKEAQWHFSHFVTRLQWLFVPPPGTFEPVLRKPPDSSLQKKPQSGLSESVGTCSGFRCEWTAILVSFSQVGQRLAGHQKLVTDGTEVIHMPHLAPGLGFCLTVLRTSYIYLHLHVNGGVWQDKSCSERLNCHQASINSITWRKIVPQTGSWGHLHLKVSWRASFMF